MQNKTPTTDGDGSQPLSSAQVAQIMQIGEEAAQLLQAPVYQLAYRTLLDEAFADWLASHPKEREKRESLWCEAQGLIKMTEKLQTAVEHAANLLQQQKDERPQGSSLENQGFGLDH